MFGDKLSNIIGDDRNFWNKKKNILWTT